MKLEKQCMMDDTVGALWRSLVACTRAVPKQNYAYKTKLYLSDARLFFLFPNVVYYLGLYYTMMESAVSTTWNIIFFSTLTHTFTM